MLSVRVGSENRRLFPLNLFPLNRFHHQGMPGFTAVAMCQKLFERWTTAGCFSQDWPQWWYGVCLSNKSLGLAQVHGQAGIFNGEPVGAWGLQSQTGGRIDVPPIYAGSML